MNDHNLTILLVDDLEFYRDLMRNYLKRTPATILMANSGPESIDMSLKERPDLIYMDASMPGMSGIEACKVLKSNPTTKSIPVLLLFTPNRDVSLEEVEQSGCDRYLSKPFARQDFINLGHDYLFKAEHYNRRVPCRASIQFSVAGRSYQGRVNNISLNGLYIEFRDQVPQGGLIEATFVLPKGIPESIEVKGRICWINQGFPRQKMHLPQGFGVKFLECGIEKRELYMSFLENHYNE